MKNIKKAFQELWAIQNELDVAPRDDLKWMHPEHDVHFFRRKWYGRQDLVISIYESFTWNSLLEVITRLRKVIKISNIRFNIIYNGATQQVGISVTIS